MSIENIQGLAQAMKAIAPIGQGFSENAAAQRAAGASRIQGQQALEGALAEEAIHRRQSKAELARQTANAIAQGSFVGGSSADVIRESEVNAIADALAIRHRGLVQQAGFENQARALEFGGKQAQAGGFISAGQELLDTAYKRRLRALGVQ